MARLILLALVALGLAPGLFLRTPTGSGDDAAQVAIAPVAERDGVSGPLRLTGAWLMTSPHSRFGGFSALVATGPGRLMAGTDRGFLLELDVARPVPRAVPGSFAFVGVASTGARKEVIDLEALSHDPATGTLWAAFENANAVHRLAPAGAKAARAPAEMADWNANSGPETMERLADGRFLVLAESPAWRRGEGRPALLFAGDPVVTRDPLAFRFEAEPGYAPVDATALPDGRVLILLRRVRYSLPARFDTAIAIADPRAIRAGKAWRGRVIQRLTGGIFADNFEGIAYLADPNDPARGGIWLVSDDNFSAFQRSLLVRFAWPGEP